MGRRSIASTPRLEPPRDWREFPPSDLSPILRTALSEIVAHGYDATSVRVIADGVGVTVPALYYHFKNKQAILVALLDHALDIVTSHVHGVVEAVCLYMAHHRDLAFLDSERRALTPPNLEHYVARRDEVEKAVRDAIDDGCDGGVFRTVDPAECSRAILSMCQGISSWFSPDGESTAEETASRYVRIALATVEYVEA